MMWTLQGPVRLLCWALREIGRAWLACRGLLAMATAREMGCAWGPYEIVVAISGAS